MKRFFLIISIVLVFISCDFNFSGKKDKSEDDPAVIERWKYCLRYDNNRWNKAIGPEYIEMAFIAAREADPQAKLFYNDYNLNNQYKAQAVYRMVKDINSRYPNVKGRKLIDGIGMQSHHHINTNPKTVEDSIILFASLGVDVVISEMDIMAAGEIGNSPSIPWDDNAKTKQADVYKSMFEIFLKHSSKISRVTFWGIDDGTSWRKNNYPTLLDKDYGLKPAFFAVAGKTINNDTWNTAESLYKIHEKNFFTGNVISPDDLNNTTRFNILKRHYNTVTAENHMKPDYIAPYSKPSGDNWIYRFSDADKIVNAANAAGMKVVGHTLVWHSQTPQWLTEGDKKTVVYNLNKYVTDVSAYFKGRLISWDVVNEAIRDGLTANDVNY